ncbi:hypothetical protein CRENBAI_002259 [Crenichthys baileyi]|uniref:Uncharacterized protein n=1 Tax=Crenichthys baileyi TaxID=28760 RepID=A0AAV9RE81_9TELE
MRHLPTDVEVLPSLLPEHMERRENREGAQLLLPLLRLSPPAPLAARQRRNHRKAEAEKTLRRSTGLPLPQSAYDGSRLPIPCLSYGSEAHVLLPPQETSARSTFLLFGRRGGLPSPRLAAALRMPSSRAPAQVSAATPDKLEERLCFFARQIKSFRRTSLLYSSPELREKIGQMEEGYETAVRQFYCRPPLSSSGLQSGAAAQSTPGLQGAATEQPTLGVQSAAAVQPTSGLQSGAAAQPSPCLQNKAAAQPTSCLQMPAIVLPKSASTSSIRCRGCWKRDASAQVIGGPGETSAQVIGGPGDA